MFCATWKKNNNNNNNVNMNKRKRSALFKPYFVQKLISQKNTNNNINNNINMSTTKRTALFKPYFVQDWSDRRTILTKAMLTNPYFVQH